MQEYQDLLQVYQNLNSTNEQKLKLLSRAIHQNDYFRNMIKNHDGAIHKLLQVFKLREYKRKDIVYKNSKSVKEVHWILSGQMSCWNKKTEQDMNTEMKLNGIVKQFIANNNISDLTKDQQDRFQNIQTRLNLLRDIKLDEMIREIDNKNQYFQLNDLCNLKRTRFLEVGQIAGENCAISGMKYDGLCVVSSESCWVLSITTEQYHQIFNMNQDNFYLIKETLQSVFGFANQKLITHLAYQFDELKYQYNQVIYSEGDLANCVYIIKSGEVEIVKALDEKQLSSLKDNTFQNLIEQKTDAKPQINKSEQTQQESENNTNGSHSMKRKLKQKKVEYEIVLRNSGVLGLEDYEVEVTNAQNENIREDTNSIQKVSKKNVIQKNDLKKQKIRYVKAISKSNETVLLRIRDKYIDNLLRGQGVNRAMLSAQMKEQKLEFHGQRLKKLHDYMKTTNSFTKIQPGISQAINININEANNIHMNNNIYNTTNISNNIGSSIFSLNSIDQSNSITNNNLPKIQDDIQINSSILKKTEQNQSTFTYLSQKSQNSLGIFTNRSLSDQERNINLNNNQKEYDDQVYSSYFINESQTPQNKPIIKRSAIRHLSQIEIQSADKKNYDIFKAETQPTPLKQKLNTYKYSDYSTISTFATTSSLNSMQKLSPTINLPISGFKKNQQHLNKIISNSSTMNSPLPDIHENQNRTLIKRKRIEKTLTENIQYDFNREVDIYNSPHLNQKATVYEQEKMNQQLEIIQKYDFEDYFNSVNIQNNIITNNQLLEQNKNNLRNSTNVNTEYQRPQLNLLFLLPEKTKILNQKRLAHQNAMFLQNIKSQKLKQIPQNNIQNKKNLDINTNPMNLFKNDIISLSEIDQQQVSNNQLINNQEQLPNKNSNLTLSTNDKNTFLKKLKDIHPTLQKLKTLAFDEPSSDSLNSSDKNSEKNQVKTSSNNQNQQINTPIINQTKEGEQPMSIISFSTQSKMYETDFQSRNLRQKQNIFQIPKNKRVFEMLRRNIHVTNKTQYLASRVKKESQHKNILQNEQYPSSFDNQNFSQNISSLNLNQLNVK